MLGFTTFEQILDYIGEGNQNKVFYSVGSLEQRKSVFYKVSIFIRPVIKERAMISKSSLLRVG